MKNLKLLVVLITGVLFTTSCKKDYNCECDITLKEPTFGMETNSKTAFLLKDYKKKTAKQECENIETNMTSNWINAGGTYTGSCEIK